MHVHSHHSASCHCSVPSNRQQLRALRIALVLVTCFSIAEFWVSLQSHSLSLLADASDAGLPLAQTQFEQAKNMTQSLAALRELVHNDADHQSLLAALLRRKGKEPST